jgi:hypothetical protein
VEDKSSKPKKMSSKNGGCGSFSLFLSLSLLSFLCAFLILSSSPSEAFTFTVQAGSLECFYQHFLQHANEFKDIAFLWELVRGTDSNIKIRITSPSGEPTSFIL